MAAPSTSTYTPPGRLGNPDLDLGSDPRTNRKLLQALTPMGFNHRQPEEALTISSPMDQIEAMIAGFEGGIQGMYDSMPNELPGDEHEPAVDETTETIKGVDGNDIRLHIFRRAGTEGKKLPAVVYTHGGGMSKIRRVLHSSAFNRLTSVTKP